MEKCECHLLVVYICQFAMGIVCSDYFLFKARVILSCSNNWWRAWPGRIDMTSSFPLKKPYPNTDIVTVPGVGEQHFLWNSEEIFARVYDVRYWDAGRKRSFLTFKKSDNKRIGATTEPALRRSDNGGT